MRPVFLRVEKEGSFWSIGHPHRVGKRETISPLRNCTTVHPHRMRNFVDLKYLIVPVLSVVVRRDVFIPTRGEHIVGFITGLFDSGSSPHAWGTQGDAADQLLEERFIPTRVGNTRCVPDRDRPAPVHPHTRGEHS